MVGGWAASTACASVCTGTGNNICQTQVSASDSLLLLQPAKLSKNDYYAETKVTAKNPNTSANPSVELVFRVTSVTPATAYHCLVDLKNHRLELAKHVAGTWTSLKTTNTNTVPGLGPFRLLAVAKGSSLTCTDLQSGQTLGANDTSLASGSVGFVAFQTQACFEYLMVLAPP